MVAGPDRVDNPRDDPHFAPFRRGFPVCWAGARLGPEVHALAECDKCLMGGLPNDLLVVIEKLDQLAFKVVIPGGRHARGRRTDLGTIVLEFLLELIDFQAR